MKKVLLSLSLISIFALSSCEKGKEAVATQEAQAEASASSDAKEQVIDTEISSVTWRGFKFYEKTKEEGGHHGHVKLKSGNVSIKDNALQSGNFAADFGSFESLDLNDDAETKAKLDGHLKSADFLDLEKHPEASFTITAVSPLTEGDYNSEISGNLKLRDIVKNISFKANVIVGEDKTSIKSEEFAINRKDFGIVFSGAEGSVIKNDVMLQVDITTK